MDAVCHTTLACRLVSSCLETSWLRLDRKRLGVFNFGILPVDALQLIFGQIDLCVVVLGHDVVQNEPGCLNLDQPCADRVCHALRVDRGRGCLQSNTSRENSLPSLPDVIHSYRDTFVVDHHL